MKKVLVFRHIAHEGLGTIEQFLNHTRFKIHYLDLFKNSLIPKDPDEYDFIISMGGPMNVDETDRFPFLKVEREFIRKAIYAGKTVLGICLGAQMIARALEARVYPAPQKEIGWFPIELSEAGKADPVFRTFGNQNPTAFQWHGDTFDLPKGAVHLAASELCPNQAFRFGNSVYAFQFHVEVTPEMIMDWLTKGVEELKSVRPPVSEQAIIQSISKHAPVLKSAAERIYESIFSTRIFERAKN